MVMKVRRQAWGGRQMKLVVLTKQMNQALANVKSLVCLPIEAPFWLKDNPFFCIPSLPGALRTRPALVLM